MIAHDLIRATQRYEEIYLSFQPMLDSTQLILLSSIPKEGIRSSKLAEVIDMDVALTRDLLHRIRKRGFIERKGVYTLVTKRGEEAITQSKEAVKRAEDAFLSLLQPVDRSIFKANLARTTGNASLSQTL